MSLATIHRPKSFDDVVEQTIPVKILKEELATDNLKQAYLFVGKQGAGKTSCARILAKEINGFTIEIDVASHNSADDMRELIKSIKTKPIGYNKIVVILDEAHVGSSAFFQSLLLTLEQPPKHVVFILCTTEGDKIIETIKSRCEVFHFLPISPESIAKRLAEICIVEKFEYVDNALIAIAKQSNGSMRQAITYLEMLSTNTIDMDNVINNLVKSSYNTCFDILYAKFDNNMEDMVKSVENIEANKFVPKFFTFILDLNLYFKTNSIEITGLPAIMKNEIDKFNNSEKELLAKLLEKLYTLQYEGKNSPILKEMFVACILLA